MQAMKLQPILANCLAAYNTCVQFAITINVKPKRHQYPFCYKNCVNIDIKLDAEIKIWIQSGYDG